jgi:chromatin segregation and condensation protein Rec8/ScpA/Scc1 (kleisin family)
LYQIYRDAGLIIQNEFGRQVMYEPEYTPPHEPIFVTDSFCTIPEMASAIERVITSLPRTETKPTAKVRTVISLEDMMTKLRRRIETQMSTRFSELRAREKDHTTVIVSFLAILELFKQGNIIITQAKRFDDIELELESPITPRYY